MKNDTKRRKQEQKRWTFIKLFDLWPLFLTSTFPGGWTQMNPEHIPKIEHRPACFHLLSSHAYSSAELNESENLLKFSVKAILTQLFRVLSHIHTHSHTTHTSHGMCTYTPHDSPIKQAAQWKWACKTLFLFWKTALLQYISTSKKVEAEADAHIEHEAHFSARAARMH